MSQNVEDQRSSEPERPHRGKGGVVLRAVRALGSGDGAGGEFAPSYPYRRNLGAKSLITLLKTRNRAYRGVTGGGTSSR